MSDHPFSRNRCILILVLGTLAFLLTGCELPSTHEPFSNYSVADWLSTGVFLTMLALAYMLPTAIAIITKHPAVLGIGVLNLILGWTGLIWVAVFIWACIKPGKPVTIIQQAYRPNNPPPLPAVPVTPSLETQMEELHRLKDRNLINEEEFQKRRGYLLERF